MMFKKKYYLLFIIVVLLIIKTSSIYAYGGKALIIYEKEKTFRTDENKINYLNELLYVFNNKVEKVNINDYNLSYMNNFDSVFIININNDIQNIDLLTDLSTYKNKIYWIGDKIENFLDYSKIYKLNYESKSNNITKLSYKGDDILVDDENLFNIVNNSNESEIIATMTDGYNIYPFIINEKNLYYISRWDLNKSFIFEDSLNNFYRVRNFEIDKIFIDISSSNPLTNIKELREIADYLYSQDISFIISLTPRHLDGEAKVISTIQYMQEKGGTVVLSGYTYNAKAQELEANYVFDNIKDELSNGIRLCLKNKIYPLAIELPDDEIDFSIYQDIKENFFTCIGSYKSNNENLSTTSFPYMIKDSYNFKLLIPKNLGSIDDKDVFTVDKLKERFEKLSMVRGYTGGFSFDSGTDIAYLKEIVEYLRDEGVQFIDLKSLNNKIKVDDIKIISKDGKIDYSYDKSKTVSKEEGYTFDVFIQNINKVVIYFVSIILILFLIIFIVFRKINTRKFRRRQY